MGALIPLFAQLALQGVSVYQQMQGAAASNNVTAITALIPMAADIYTATQEAGSALKKAQDEGWKDDDPRWQPVIATADAALKAAEARL